MQWTYLQWCIEGSTHRAGGAGEAVGWNWAVQWQHGGRQGRREGGVWGGLFFQDKNKLKLSLNLLLKLAACVCCA